jgi:hypothetical protein
VRGGAGHEAEAFYMSSIGSKGCVVVQNMKGMTSLHQASLQELVKRVRDGAGPEGDDQPAPRCAPQPARHHPAAGEGRPAC